MQIEKLVKEQLTMNTMGLPAIELKERFTFFSAGQHRLYSDALKRLSISGMITIHTDLPAENIESAALAELGPTADIQKISADSKDSKELAAASEIKAKPPVVAPKKVEPAVKPATVTKRATAAKG